MQEIEIMGTLTSQVELEASPGHGQYVQFGLAIEEAYQVDEVYFVPVIVFGKLAKKLSEIGHKGQRLRIAGKVSQGGLMLPNGKSVNRLKIVGESYQVI